MKFKDLLLSFNDLTKNPDLERFKFTVYDLKTVIRQHDKQFINV